MLQKCAMAFAAALCCMVLSARASGQGDAPRPMSGMEFELSISQEFGEGAAPAIVVTVSVPYRRLVFFVRGQRYEARYRVYLELKDAHGKEVRGEVWEESVVTGDFNETTSSALMASSRRTFSIDPGDYRAEVTIEVIDTSRRFKSMQGVHVVGADALRIELSTPTFYTHPGDTAVGKPRDGEIAVSTCPPTDKGAMRINPGAVYGDFAGWLHIVCSVVVPSREGRTSFVLTARVRNTRGIIILYTRKSFDRVDSGHAALCLDINIDNLQLGEYEIELVAEAAGEEQKSESEGRFVVLFNQALLGDRIGDLMELLSLIGDEKDARTIADAAPAERINAWNDFWLKRDRMASTRSVISFGEFLNRLRYVLANFSRTAQGWRTDMGRTYMQDGAPDKVESRQDARTGRSYEVWYYYSKGIAYVFEDVIGIGEYRLLTTEMI